MTEDVEDTKSSDEDNYDNARAALVRALYFLINDSRYRMTIAAIQGALFHLDSNECIRYRDAKDGG